MLQAYEGNQPYVFVSYSHKDSQQVLLILQALQQRGLRFWYDAGIEAGSEWPEYIAARLTDCACVLAFVSENFAASDNCRRELTFCLNLKKPALSLYLDDRPISAGLQLQLGLVQALRLADHADTEGLANALCASQILEICQAAAPKTGKTRAKTPLPHSNDPTVETCLVRAFLSLEDQEWELADRFCEQVLNIDPKNARAYLGKLMAKLQVPTEKKLASQKTPFDQEGAYKKALRFGDEGMRAALEGYINTINKRIERNRLAREKREKEKQELAAQQEKERKRLAAKQEREKRKLLAAAKAYLAEVRQKLAPAQALLSAANSHTVALPAGGTPVSTGYNTNGQRNLSDWKDIVAISAGAEHSVGLKADGTVIATRYSGVLAYDGRCDVSGWTNITAVSAGNKHTVGLKADGTVVAVGKNDYGQCNVSGWQNIVAISAGDNRTVGLRADGTVVSIGWLDHARDLANWQDIVAISTGGFRTAGLKADGTVVLDTFPSKHVHNVEDWSDIVAISEGYSHTVGLRADGTVVAIGDNADGQCLVFDWQNIVAISAGARHTVGLRADGTVVTAGSNQFSQCDTSDWKLFTALETLPQEQTEAREKAEQARLAKAREEQQRQEQLQRRREEEARRRREEEARKKEELKEQLMRQRIRDGLCCYCGGKFKGFFVKKCTNCGKYKDY